MKRIEDWMNPPDYAKTTKVGWVFRLIAWIIYGILWVALGLLALAVLFAFVAYGIPGTEV